VCRAEIGLVERCTSENGTKCRTARLLIRAPKPGGSEKNLEVGEWASTVPLVTHGPPSLCSQSSQSQLPFETQPGPGQLQCPRVPAIQLTLYIAISTASKRAGCQMKEGHEECTLQGGYKSRSKSKRRQDRAAKPEPSRRLSKLLRPGKLAVSANPLSLKVEVQ
jgi:hypothetical protein